jgi:hypothetical protein
MYTTRPGLLYTSGRRRRRRPSPRRGDRWRSQPRLLQQPAAPHSVVGIAWRVTPPSYLLQHPPLRHGNRRESHGPIPSVVGIGRSCRWDSREHPTPAPYLMSAARDQRTQSLPPRPRLLLLLTGVLCRLRPGWSVGLSA